MAEYTGWRIVTGFHGSDLFAETDGIDVDESISRYAEMVEAALMAAYPGAEVDVRYDVNTSGVLPHNLQTRCYPPNDEAAAEDEIPTIDDIAARVYESWDWLIYAPETEAANS